ncbi:Bro-N domain-containing protein [Streptomyces sp. NPDC048717]|uniref:BRO-N domain-containing protein n=1 Tax=Streptomyces sp. NPDC048717 TaxID=3154928 RepID=UPI00341BF52D
MKATDAIDVDDFVYAATGSRLRRLTLPDGTHWFPAVDAARQLGYASARQALRAHVDPAMHTTVGELPCDPDTAAQDAHPKGLKDSTRVVCLEGLVQLVTASARVEARPFKTWVAEVVTGVQRDGSYGLELSPLRAAGFVLPQQLLDVLVRLEEGTIELDAEQSALLEEAGRDLHRIAERISESLGRFAFPQIPAQRSLGASSPVSPVSPVSPAAPAAPPSADGRTDRTDRTGRSAGSGSGTAGASADNEVTGTGSGGGSRSPALTPQELLASWSARDVVVGEDIHAVASCLAPALVRGGVRYRLEEVARRTGLTSERVRDCVRILVERGCMRHAGGTGADGGLLYVLP